MLGAYLNIWLPAVGLSFLMFAYLLELALDHLRAKDWPQTPGKIIESAVEEVTGESSPGTAFLPRIRFTYEADGKSWESRQFAFHVHAGSRDRAESIAARYPVGSEVTVLFRPDLPQQAVLEPGKAWPSVAFAVGSGLLFILSFAAWLGESRAAG